MGRMATTTPAQMQIAVIGALRAALEIQESGQISPEIEATTGIPGFDIAVLPGQSHKPIEIDQVRRLVSDITDRAAAHYQQVIIAFAKAFMALAAQARTYGADPAEALQELALRTAADDGEG